MKRRDFLKLMGAAGITATFPTPFQLAHAATPDRFWLTVHCNGGWDPTSLIDPKGNAPRSDGKGPVNNYATDAIKQVGNIRYAPYPAFRLNTENELPGQGSFDAFFEAHADKLMVINGIDTQTNSHDTGTRHVWSGHSQMGYPSFAALVAGINGPEQPLSYISNGGYDHTAGLVAPTRISDSNTFTELAYPNREDPKKAESYFLHPNVDALKQQAQQERLMRQQAQASLPKEKAALSQLHLVKGETSALNQLVANLENPILEEINPQTTLGKQARYAAASFASGIAVSANMTVGGFDTHGDHDDRHYPSLAGVLDGLTETWTLLEALGIADKTTIIVSSDFGRTPYYNSGAGKDHWNVTSMMLMGAGIQGNRVIGGTDDLVRPLKVNPDTLALDPNGITITPAHVHQALRELAGVQTHAYSTQFPFEVDSLPLFTPLA